MNNDHLKVEVDLGRKADQAYRSFIEGYIADKKKTLFENFLQAGVAQTDILQEVKRNYSILEDMENSVQTIVNTGKMATTMLNNAED
jgi:hypothetical protein